jgi:eukaryotic-like serine/threonine-protein kinase
MSDIRSYVNRDGGEEERPSLSFHLTDVCPTCGAAGETPTPDSYGALTDVNGEMPPPPHPLPDAVAQMAATLLVAPESAGAAGLPVVAGYELLAPLGRGGMGVVYQARQLQSNRMVALKLILGGAHARPRDLARFRKEAEAVAQLAHPHIVQMYEVGEQDGWAYFALEFVPGGSLAQQCAGRPQPAVPSARLVEAVAHAMAYAHERGVVHRDLKPANILLAADGTPKVTDFGLAKRLDLEPGTSLSLGRTRTGEVLGTPSYMAPEQTFGQPDEVGPAADVYALGAILYECLTGRPPFQAATPLDTLLQVRGDDPVPPTRLVPSVPRDLETICLKCLQKEPQRRYPSATTLAEDLRRFLAGEPISARPISFPARAIRWARRRKAAAALVGVSVVAVLSLVILGAWHQVRLQGFNTELRVERDAAERLRTQAQAKEAEARQQKEEAEAHFRSALAAVKQMLVLVSEEDDRLAHEPRMELVRSKLLEDALRFYQGFLKERPGDPEVRWEMASTYLRIGDIRKRLGKQAAAEEAYRAAITLFQALAAEFPRQPGYRHGLAGCYTNLGTLLANTPRQEEAEQAFQRARDIQEALTKEYPTSAKYRSALAGSEHNLATLLAIGRRLPQAEQALRRALEPRRRLAAEFPQEAFFRRDFARTLNNLADVLSSANRPKDAEQAYREALVVQRRLVEEFPRDPTYRQELASSHNGLANVLDTLGDTVQAESEYTHALTLQQRLVEEFPRVPGHRQELARMLHNLALLQHRTGRSAEAEQTYRRALDVRQRLIDESPNVPTFQSELGRTAAHLGDLLIRSGRAPEARQQAERAIRHQHVALKLIPGHPGYRLALGLAYRVRAEALVQLGDHAAAAQAVAELPRPSPPDEQADCLAAGILARCISLAEQDSTLPAQKRAALAKAYASQAIALLRHSFRRGSGSSLARLKTDPQLAPLQSRPDFQKLIRELEEITKPADK